MEPDRVALITGASRGLGLALARELSRRAWKLVIDARGAPAVDEVRRELESRTQVRAVAGGTANERHPKDLIEAARSLGSLRLVVNNASLLGPSPQPALAAYPIDVLERVYRVNTVAPLRLIQLALPLLQERPGGRIVNI